MEIVITESQYNRVVLNEQSKNNSTQDKVLYSDNNIVIKAFGVDSKSGGYILPKSEADISISNKNATSPIIVNIEKSSPIFEFFDGKKKYSSQIRPKFTDIIIVGLNQSIGEGRFTGNLTFAYVIPGKAPVVKSINIPFVREGTVKSAEIKSQNEIFYNCKSKYNSDLLKKATDWWKNWLKSKSTQQRFADTFGYGLGYVEQIFFQYVKILDQIKMEYVIDKTRSNAGWVSPKLKSGYNIPIIINCPAAMELSKTETDTFLIHEIQHVLSSYHRFEHPLKDNFFKDFFNFYKDLFTGMLKSEPEDKEFKLDRNSTSYKTLYKFLTSQGFKDDTIDPLLYTYFWRLRYDEDHLKKRNEIRSSLAELRRGLKLNPNQKITKELLINNALNDTVDMFIHQWLFSGQPLSEFLNYYNSLAMGNPNTTDKNLA
jgi:hypothetical protein